MEPITIQKAKTTDWRLLQDIGRHTFAETFAADNTPENMEKYLQEGFSDAKIQAELADPQSDIYLAWHKGAVIGYLKLNHGAAQTERQSDTSLEIERIYVAQAYQGQKVGQLLFEKALAVAQDTQVAEVWLGVWEKNTKAIQFYKKNGFEPFDTHIFVLGDDHQVDIMMRRSIQ